MLSKTVHYIKTTKHQYSVAPVSPFLSFLKPEISQTRFVDTGFKLGPPATPYNL